MSAQIYLGVAVKRPSFRIEVAGEVLADGLKCEKVAGEVLADGLNRKKVAGEVLADGLKREKVAGEVLADGLKQEKVAGEVLADGQNRKRLPARCSPMDKIEKGCWRDARRWTKTRKGCVAEGFDGGW